MGLMKIIEVVVESGKGIMEVITEWTGGKIRSVRTIEAD